MGPGFVFLNKVGKAAALPHRHPRTTASATLVPWASKCVCRAAVGRAEGGGSPMSLLRAWELGLYSITLALVLS